ncbi:hypothetical protein TMES_12455 [Thalassospira mesophila]|uniref:Uncharacterized protein n=1 Tax=Thalassospira mesophila TaxID=1293891 RepID=A0A1Y2KYM0_9PROT|nr:hypothetical protein TMES_12455 [Thalassospira mesophila]
MDYGIDICNTAPFTGASVAKLSFPDTKGILTRFFITISFEHPGIPASSLCGDVFFIFQGCLNETFDHPIAAR